MRGNRGTGTEPERLLKSALRKLGCSFFAAAPKELPGRPDLVFRSARLAVFVHGCFWHRCPRHVKALPKTNTDYWRAKFARNTERDSRKAANLRLLGWHPYVLWECEIRRSPESCAIRILELVGRTKRRSRRADSAN